MPVPPLDRRRGRDVRRGDAVRGAGRARCGPGSASSTSRPRTAVIEICETLDGLPLGIELAAARMAAMSAVEVRDRLGDRFRLLTGPELRPGSSARPCSTRWRGPTTCWTTTSARRCGTASVFAGGFDLPCAVRRRRGDRRHRGRCGSWTRWSASPWSSPTTAPRGRGTACSRPSGRSPTNGWRRPASARRLRDRHAAYFADEAAGRWEQWNGPGWRDPGRLGADASWPTCGRRSGGASTAVTSRWPPTSPPTRR